MPAPQTHFRVAIGEYNGGVSYMAQSAKNITYQNIPKDLITLLGGVSHQNILDFSFGSSGRYYIKWKDPQGVVKQNVSQGLWQMIGQAPNTTLDRLSLGAGDSHWGVRVAGNDNVAFRRLGPTTMPQILAAELVHGLSNIQFVSLSVEGIYCYNNAGTTHTDALPLQLRTKIQLAVQQRRTITNVVLSPNSTTTWVIMYSDGKYDGMLPSNLANDLDAHAQPQNSLLLPSAPQANVTSPTIRTLSTGSTEFIELRSLFLSGWLHPHKSVPAIVNICAIDLPQSLLRPYQAYRLQLEQQLGQQQLNERKTFHGTPRRCCIGDPTHNAQLCSDTDCNLCWIIRTSFRLDRAGTAPGRNFMRFGRGLYTTSVSSKADDYNISQKPSSSPYKAVVVAKVVLGSGYPLLRTTKSLTAPPGGFNSVR
ncbi:hypothetical protein FRB95_000813 [Tulasnella sp. JGI-2019a]|nr:hypothetical protein FRB95_000813 [Tulasnella sp. JGI-2019a]